jgi:hypothetical protein
MARPKLSGQRGSGESGQPASLGLALVANQYLDSAQAKAG